MAGFGCVGAFFIVCVVVGCMSPVSFFIHKARPHLTAWAIFMGENRLGKFKKVPDAQTPRFIEEKPSGILVIVIGPAGFWRPDKKFPRSLFWCFNA